MEQYLAVADLRESMRSYRSSDSTIFALSQHHLLLRKYLRLTKQGLKALLHENPSFPQIYI